MLIASILRGALRGSLWYTRRSWLVVQRGQRAKGQRDQARGKSGDRRRIDFCTGATVFHVASRDSEYDALSPWRSPWSGSIGSGVTRKPRRAKKRRNARRRVVPARNSLARGRRAWSAR